MQVASPAPQQSPGNAAPPNGRALVVADCSAEPDLRQRLAEVGYGIDMAADPYTAMRELVRRPLAFRAVLLSLAALHLNEIELIEVLKRRFPHLEVLLADAAGRSEALTRAVALGADALLEGQRLHRLAAPTLSDTSAPDRSPSASDGGDLSPPEPVLSNEELKALLQD